MTTKTRTVTDSDIRQVIIGQGFADCSVVRQVLPYRPGNENECGSWFVMFVDGQCWGRRRTMQELLKLATRGPCFEANR